MKKLVSLLLSAAMMLSVFSGCGSPSNSSEATGNSSSADKNTTITFGFWGDANEANMKMQLANAYMKEHPNVKIQFIYTDGNGYLTKMQTWLSSNTVPDVFGVASDTVFQFLGSDQFENLKPYIEKDSLEKDWNMDTVNSIYSSNGKICAVPFISKDFAIAYNKKLFDAAGLAYPTNDWTEDDMIKDAKALTKGSGTNKTYGIRWGVRPTEFYRNLYGNAVYDFKNNTMNAKNNDQFKHAVSLFADTIKEGLAPDETSSAISTGGFETGKFGMQLCATWDISTFQSMIGNNFKWDVVMLPVNKQFNTRMLSTYRGNGWSMSSSSKAKDVCWDFIKYMTVNKESQKAAQNYGMPEYQSYLNSKEYLNDFGTGTAYNKQAFIDMLKYSTSFYNLGVYAQINDVIKTQYELLIANKTSVDQLTSEVQKQGEALLASSK